MPQFDFSSFVVQLFWLFIFLFLFYYFILFYYLPILKQLFTLRSLYINLIHKKQSFFLKNYLYTIPKPFIDKEIIF